jgi:ribosomal protein S12 methylthiotransferase
VDRFIGTGAFNEIVSIVCDEHGFSKCHLPDVNRTTMSGPKGPSRFGPPYLSYLKIAEGCDRHCTYCIIPKLRGRQKSRLVDDILDEAQSAVKSGIKELVLVAQDSTGYGRDLGTQDNLASLLHRLVKISADAWIRVLYGHPESIDAKTIDAIAEHEKVCTYFDLPIQHAAGRVLKRMGRNYTRDDLYTIFDTIRSRAPKAALRTTVITGFPGESDSDFETLTAFIKEIRFDHLGVFIYSDAEDLPSSRFARHVSKKTAQTRYDHLMSLQRTIACENNARHLDEIYPVLVEKETENHIYTGRTPFQAPEVDGSTIIHGKGLNVGQFCLIRITDALEYDLVGEVA